MKLYFALNSFFSTEKAIGFDTEWNDCSGLQLWSDYCVILVSLWSGVEISSTGGTAIVLIQKWISVIGSYLLALSSSLFCRLGFKCKVKRGMYIEGFIQQVLYYSILAEEWKDSKVKWKCRHFKRLKMSAWRIKDDWQPSGGARRKARHRHKTIRQDLQFDSCDISVLTGYSNRAISDGSTTNLHTFPTR